MSTDFTLRMVKPTQTLTRNNADYVEGSGVNPIDAPYVHPQVLGIVDAVSLESGDGNELIYRVNFGGYGIWYVRGALIAQFSS
jgi:hypothetical protein